MSFINPKKQVLLDSLYSHCQMKTNTSIDVMNKILEDLKLVISESQFQQALEIVRQYKSSGKNLEANLNALYDVLYPLTTPSSNGGPFDWSSS